MSNAQAIADRLNGSAYPFDPPREIADDARASGLVIVFGASDDLMEFRGAINDELAAYDGTTAHLTSAGLLTNECGNDECPHFDRLKKSAATIDAVWAADGYSWTFATTIPHATFEVREDDENYCRGIVFALADVKP